MFRERLVIHRLPDLKLLRFFARPGGNGFVDVGRHRQKLNHFRARFKRIAKKDEPEGEFEIVGKLAKVREL